MTIATRVTKIEAVLARIETIRAEQAVTPAPRMVPALSAAKARILQRAPLGVQRQAYFAAHPGATFVSRVTVELWIVEAIDLGELAVNS